MKVRETNGWKMINSEKHTNLRESVINAYIMEVNESKLNQNETVPNKLKSPSSELFKFDSVNKPKFSFGEQKEQK